MAQTIRAVNHPHLAARARQQKEDLSHGTNDFERGCLPALIDAAQSGIGDIAMSDIRITSSGRVFYRVDPTLAAILKELLPAAVENVNENTGIHIPPVTAPPKWFVGTDGGQYPFIGYTFGGETRRYNGPPDKAVDGLKTKQWSGEKEDYIFEGPEPPASVIEQYRQSYDAQPTPPPAFLPAVYHSAARGGGEK